MGVEKNRLIKEGEKRNAATQIALDAGLLTECINHSGTLVDTSSGDNAPGYALADSLFLNGKLTDTFASRQEMVSLVDDVVSEAGGQCEECAALSRPD